jgi:hypothetical protein
LPVPEWLRWLAFVAGLAINTATVVAVMKTLLVPRRSWSLLSAFIGRMGYRFFYGVARRLPSYDLADRFLGFHAPVVIIGILVSLLGSFVIGFALMLLPWADLTLGDALREAGSSVFTLGFVSTEEPVPTFLNVAGGATGMIFVALTIGYLPGILAEVRGREATVRRLEAVTGTPPWGPEVLARYALSGAVERLPALYEDWDHWCARVAETHLKYPVLSHFRLPRARNHWVVSLLSIMDAAALDIVLRPSEGHGPARLLLTQGLGCLSAAAYPMRRIERTKRDPCLDRPDFDEGVRRMETAGFPIERAPDQAWPVFERLRSEYAPLAAQLAYWLIAAPAPWSGTRLGFPDLEAVPDRPPTWVIA